MKLKIGITFHAKEGQGQIWSNGITQNAYFLAKMLINTGHDVCLANTSKIEPKLEFEDNIKIVNYHEIKNKLNVVILLGSDINVEDFELHRNNKCKIVYYNCGNEYMFNMENNLFKKETFTKHFHNIDEIWIIPQLMKQNEFFHTVLNRSKIKEVNFIWDSYFIDLIVSKMKTNCLYKPKDGPKRISIFEPNINTVKFCMYPVLIAEAAYRENSKLLDKVYVTNADRIKTNVEFVSIVEHLDLFMDSKIFFESRFILPVFLADYTDVVVSHQWENPLNYAYLDTVYLGYPLVHNAYLCKDLGYYYNEFDGEEGKNQLIKALTEHDKNNDEYFKKHRELLYRYSPNNPENIKFYTDMINNLFGETILSVIKKGEIEFDVNDNILFFGDEENYKLLTNTYKNEIDYLDLTNFNSDKKYSLIIIYDKIQKTINPSILIDKLKDVLKDDGCILSNVKIKIVDNTLVNFYWSINDIVNRLQPSKIYDLEINNFLCEWTKNEQKP